MFFLCSSFLFCYSVAAHFGNRTRGPVELARTEATKAAAALEPMVAGGNFDALVVESLYYSWVRTGEYTKAREKFEAWAGANANAAPLRLAAGRIDHLTGNYDRALTHLNAILNFANIGVAAQFEKAAVLDDSGKHPEAEALYNKIIQNFENGLIRAPNDLQWVAGALRATEKFHDANDVLKVVTQGNPRNAEAFVTWGDLLAEKFNDPEAIASYRDALKIDPNMPEALLGVAQRLALSDPERATGELEKAMATNPNFVEGHLVIAEQNIDSEQYDKAQEEINKVLAVNPKSTEALSLLASISFFRNNKDDFDKYVKQVLETNPYYSKLYDTLAENSVSVRLYKEATGFAREALRINPKDWDAMSILGVNLMRIGEEDEGKAALDKAFARSVQQIHLQLTLDLLDKFAHFTRFEDASF
jgi:tetratricopeptide (TPR) repeat protein